MKKFNEGDVIKTDDSDPCPMCGSKENEVEDRCFEHGWFYADMFCLNCHGSYTMWFKPHHAVVQEPGIK